MILHLIEQNTDTPIELIMELRSMTRDDFYRDLRGVVIVKFIKKSNGRQRHLVCTRNPDIIKRVGQGDKLPGPGSQGYLGPDTVIPVFDLVKNDWRSFDVNTVRNVEKRDIESLRRFSRNKKYSDDQAFGILQKLNPFNRDKVSFKDNYIPRSEVITEHMALQITNDKIESFMDRI
tara:strand:+ start:225 stop:752 length:528 start_codon:yes stop_codon:yes gene_type:complete